MCYNYIIAYQWARGEIVSVEIKIDDNKIDNLSDDARRTLKHQIEIHADHIIKEANLIEQASRENGASQEITSNIVLQAVKKNKVNFKNSPRKGLLFCKIVSALSLLITGFLYDSDGFQGKPLLLISFIVTLVIATGTTVVQFILEDKE